ncbi:MAG: iron-containing alcohol dehydrogenase [Oscillospiraceae bacterium]|jgi:alcohol dehydrogenase YqhD (iron-dependent ADH family)|nr:iron-containing alcohol dehydrogenase [Oscillospiraceae bacterium]
MLNFQMHIPTKIVFGRDEQKNIGALLKPYVKQKVLLHYGGGSIKKSGLYDQITASLRAADIAFAELGGVVPNPRLDLVYKGIALCKAEGIDLILAVGGGSAIDSAKAIAMGYYFEGDIWRVFDDDLHVEKALPVATVLTIPAAGSEMSNSCVITNEAEQLKYGHTDNCTRSILSVVNPELFATLPKNQIANGIADMMSHIFERYFTNTEHTDVTDELCEGVLRAILKNAPKVVGDPSDYAAWCEIGLAGTFAHNNILGLGREQDWGCHGMEHELSAIYDIPHGAGLAVLTPNWMEYVYKTNIPMFLQFAQNVMGLRTGARAAEETILEAIAKLRAFYAGIGMVGTLTELGIDDARLEEMAKKATGYAFGEEYGQGHFKKLLWQDVLAIYKASL